MSKACPTKDGKGGNPKSPTRTSSTTRPEATTTPAVAAMAPESAHPIPPAPTSPTPSATPASQSAAPTSSSTTGPASSGAAANEGDLRDLLREANSMLKELRQIRMITAKDVEATARSLGMETETGRSGLLDSGASHA